MNRGRLTLVAVSVIVASCASDDADRSGDDTSATTVGATATLPHDATGGESTSAAGSGTDESAPAATDATAATDEADEGAVTPTSSVVDANADDGDVTVATEGDTMPSTDDSEGDEPVFDIGPGVELDTDRVSLPVDDAGIGDPTGSPPDIDGGPSPGDGGEANAVTGWAAFDRSLGEELLRPGNTAASVAVSIGGDVVHTAAFGVSDPATGDAAVPSDRFRIASISKPITAIVVLTLVRDGLVTLDQPIGIDVARHVGLDEIPDSSRSLTLRQLLTHTSGFGKYQSTFFGAGASDCADAARRGLATGAGGGGYTYSNMNYCVLGMAVEAFTGGTYESAVYERLLTPLGISGMRLPPTVDPGPGEIQHVTTPGRNYMETLGAAGAWIASPTDLVTILDSLDTSTPGFKPLDDAAVSEMVAPHNGVPGQRGYGLGIIGYGGGRVGHTGTIESTHAMVLDRGDGVTWAVTVAGSHPSESTALEAIVDRAFTAGGFVAG